MTDQVEIELPGPAVESPPAASDTGGSVDIHSHLVPGVDDGARDLAEALAALDKLRAAGVSQVLTTPHIDASLIGRPEAFDRIQRATETAWRVVVESGRERYPGMRLYLGREVMLDTPAPDLADPRVRLNGGHYVLVEFPRLNIPPGSEDVIYRLRSQGLTPIVAHVERYFYHDDRVATLDEWRMAGAALQVNAPALLGRYGPEAQDVGWELLERGWVDLMASDYHARGETWLMEAREALRAREGEEQEQLLFTINPRRVVTDGPLETVPPIPIRADRWDRLRALFRRRRGA